MPKVRLGVALLVPPPFAREIDALRRAAGDGSLGRIPAHCTLVPPVNVRDDRLVDALDVLRSAATATRPFTAHLGPPATFLPDSPVLHLPVAGDEVGRLRDLVFREPLSRALTWPFVPHVTLADELPPDRIAAAVTALSGYEVDVTFDRVHLLQEGPGRVWAPLADATFGAPAVVARGGLPIELSVTDGPDPEARALREREWPLVDLDQFGPDFRPSSGFVVTARRDGRVIGLAEGWSGGGAAYLRDLIVAAGYRGEGVGSHLLRAVESLAAERACRVVHLRAIAGSPAEAFYRRRGWVEEGRLSPWMYGRDAIEMRRDL